MRLPAISCRTPESASDIALLRSIAEKAWPSAYGDILSGKQIDYMIEWMYSAGTINSELENGVEWYIACSGGLDAGFISIGEEHGVLKLHKCYLLPEFRGKGIGSAMLQFALKRADALGFSEIYLNVNKHNLRAQKAYKRNGFEFVRSEKNDIGSGFFMDDYVFRAQTRQPAG